MARRIRRVVKRGCTGRILLAALVISAGWTRAAAAVSVSPTALYIDSRTRSATLTLHNPGTLPEEITIDFAFGYPQSDSMGKVSVALTSDPAPGEPSALGWLRAFPRRLVLQPGQRQVVRVLVEPPAGLADGEYWARILVASRGGQPPIEQTQGDIRLQLNVQTTLVMAANYRKGDVHTGFQVTRTEASSTADTVHATVALERTGNAAFLGRMQLDVLDASGTVLGTAYDDVAVYRTMLRRLDIPLTGAPSGPLRLRMRINTEREDLPVGGALPVAPHERMIPVS